MLVALHCLLRKKKAKHVASWRPVWNPSRANEPLIWTPVKSKAAMASRRQQLKIKGVQFDTKTDRLDWVFAIKSTFVFHWEQRMDNHRLFWNATVKGDYLQCKKVRAVRKIG